MPILKSPVPILTRLRNGVLAAALLLGIWNVYRFAWVDISSPIPYRSWTPAGS